MFWVASTTIPTASNILAKAKNNIEGWNEEELKFKFIAYLTDLGYLEDNGKYKTFCEREIFATVEDKYLYLKADFMIAKGVKTVCEFIRLLTIYKLFTKDRLLKY